ncbi:hypothetical protein [Tropicimonas isoalkanivorans]|uniref:Uncharacterized protein n=1 Tax=Tropicimonas isoalkanivorans TaxID=441112 RepID=A0A1I1QQH8_9RHOB|nr:hypothetical protein [Tropicimonas isoalkanivorans]SFD20320.1 hypothetical protein SAMN04488094_12018 [Tropicimonas isoalkanivorans]
MIDPADIRFFQALQQACASSDEVDPDCKDAIARAVESGNPESMRDARQSFDALDPAVKDKILQKAHRAMATDLSAIWDMLPNAPGRQRPN